MNVFKIRKVDFEETWESRFLFYSQPLFIHSISFMKDLVNFILKV